MRAVCTHWLIVAKMSGIKPSTDTSIRTQTIIASKLRIPPTNDATINYIYTVQGNKWDEMTGFVSRDKLKLPLRPP